MNTDSDLRAGRVGPDLEWALDKALDAAAEEQLSVGAIVNELLALWEERHA